MNDFRTEIHLQNAELRFGAPWAQQTLVWMILAVLLAAGLALLYYRGENRLRRISGGTIPAILRAGLLGVLVLILADPFLRLTYARPTLPELWVLFDTTESMEIADPQDSDSRTRLEQVRETWNDLDPGLIEQLQQRVTVRGFRLEGDAGISPLPPPDASESAHALAAWSDRLTPRGDITPLGTAFDELASQAAGRFVDHLIVISDFDHNAGPEPLASARRLGIPVLAVGVGPESVRDIAVNVHAPPTVKRGESTSIEAALRQTGLAGETVPVEVRLERITAGGTANRRDGDDSRNGEVLERRQVELTARDATLTLPWRPDAAGTHRIRVTAQPAPQETLTENNTAERDIQVIDDHLRLLYVAAEPNWEWRFIKEVFHRDELVGMEGFRTYLQSADPLVRQTNDLFLPGLSMPRQQFFQFDVLFLGDLPPEAISDRFCEDVKEFVGTFGGGLVLVAGPNHGMHWLVDSPLADLLPVQPAPLSEPSELFTPRLTPLANNVDFMSLAETPAENAAIWSEAGEFSWSHPVSFVDARSTLVLAENPQAVCADGRTPQPVLAIRRYGRGEVVYVGTDELWRLRKRHGETYYRRLWGQMIHRLGFSHALGAQKRFVVRTDQQVYRPGQPVRVTVEAYDENFQPLAADALDEPELTAEWRRPASTLDSAPRAVPLPMVRPGRFETELEAADIGENIVSVIDPLTGDSAAATFRVASVSAERRTGIRNANLQAALASTTGGATVELDDLPRILDSLRPEPREEITIREVSLWENWPVFFLVVTGLLAEWWLRKRGGRP